MYALNFGIFMQGFDLKKIVHAWSIEFGKVSCFQTFYTTFLIKMRYFYFLKKSLIKL